MDGFKNIEIKNFRGIDHLEIDDFSRVNVFVGQNNSGKSTVLEAIAMLMRLSNLYVPQQINAVRARKPFSNFIDIKYFFVTWRSQCRLKSLLNKWMVHHDI